MLKIISFISAGSILLPLIAGIIYFKRFDGKFIKPFFVLICLGTITEAYSIYACIHGIKTQLALDIYLILNLIFILYVYKTEINRYFYIAGLLSVIPIVIFLLQNPITEVSHIIFTIIFIQLILLSIAALHSIYEREHTDIFGKPLFWIAFGTLAYCSCTLLIFSLSKYTTDNNNTVLVTFYILYHATINIVTNIIYSRSFLCLR